MSTITTERHKESMEKFCSLIHWSHVPRRWMTSVLRRIFPAFCSTRFNDLLHHATSIVTFEKQNVVLNDMEARGHRLSFSYWSGPAVAMRYPLFFVPASKERTLGSQITLFVPARIPRIYFTSSEIKDIYWSDATSGIRERSTEPEEKSLATECPFLLW